MHKINLSDSFLPHFLDEELFLVEREFKKSKEKTIERLEITQQENVGEGIIPTLTKELLVIVRFHADDAQMAQHKTLLNKLLAAVGYRVNRVDLIDMSKMKGLRPRTIIDKSPADRVITFGVDLKNPENFDLRNYNGKKVLISCPLEFLEGSKKRKNQLWLLLKEMFKIK